MVGNTPMWKASLWNESIAAQTQVGVADTSKPTIIDFKQLLSSKAVVLRSSRPTYGYTVSYLVTITTPRGAPLDDLIPPPTVHLHAAVVLRC